MNMDNMKGMAKKVEGSAESTYGEVTGDSSARIRGEADKAQGKVLNAFSKAEDAVNSFASSAADEAEQLKTHIKEKPVQSTLIALAVGLIIGKILG